MEAIIEVQVFLTIKRRPDIKPMDSLFIRGNYCPGIQLFASKYLGRVKEGRSPSYHICPLPSGEGDTGDGASNTKQWREINKRMSKC